MTSAQAETIDFINALHADYLKLFDYVRPAVLTAYGLTLEGYRIAYVHALPPNIARSTEFEGVRIIPYADSPTLPVMNYEKVFGELVLGFRQQSPRFHHKLLYAIKPGYPEFVKYCSVHVNHLFTYFSVFEEYSTAEAIMEYVRGLSKLQDCNTSLVYDF